MSLHPWDIEAATDTQIEDDPYSLRTSALILPDLITKWGTRFADARLAAALAQQDVDIAEARAFLVAREQLRHNKPYTVEDAKAAAVLDPAYQSALTRKHVADAACWRAKSVLEALVKKADMIRETGANQRADTRV